MTNAEFSREMDIIFENINKGGAVSLDPYEKSVILTNAQEKVAYEMAINDLASVASLVKTKAVAVSPTITGIIDSRSFSFIIPEKP